MTGRRGASAGAAAGGAERRASAPGETTRTGSEMRGAVVSFRGCEMRIRKTTNAACAARESAVATPCGASGRRILSSRISETVTSPSRS